MRKNKTNDILLKKFKSSYKTIFSNSVLQKRCKNHFDKKMGFAAFVLGLVENQMGKKQTIKHVQINKQEWLKLFVDIYDNNEIINTQSILKLNPIIPLDKIEEKLNCFDKQINKIISYFESEQLNLKVNHNQLTYLLKAVFGFILYNTIDCKMFYELKDILEDPEYEQKFIMITNNTKLFSKAKNAIVNVCGSKISDLISLLLGISNDLNYDN